MMSPDQLPKFLACLNSMAELCRDEMSELRQTTYWELLSPLLSIEEWEYACKQAMLSETFHSVPMPATLVVYGKELRIHKKQGSTIPESRMLREDPIQLEEVRRLIQSIWPDQEMK